MSTARFQFPLTTIYYPFSRLNSSPKTAYSNCPRFCFLVTVHGVPIWGIKKPTYAGVAPPGIARLQPGISCRATLERGDPREIVPRERLTEFFMGFQQAPFPQGKIAQSDLADANALQFQHIQLQ